MSSRRRRRRTLLLDPRVVPVAVAIAVICIESTEMMGADHTSGPLRTIYQFIFGHVPGRRWEMIHHTIRKGGHFNRATG